MLAEHGDWLNNAEKQLAAFKYPSKLVVPVTQQINEFKASCILHVVSVSAFNPYFAFER